MKTFCIRRCLRFALTLLSTTMPAGLVAQAQVTVNFNNRVVTGPYQVVAPVYGADNALLLGSGFSAALFGGPAGVTDPGQLVFLATTTFRTQVSLAGFVVPVVAPLPPLPAPSDAFTFQVRAWDNQGGTITSWGQLISGNPTIARGMSDLFTPPPQPGASSITLVGLTCFSLGDGTIPAQFVQPPVSTNLAPGGRLSLSVVVGGSPTPAIQWRLHGTNLPGETSRTLVRTNIQFRDAGPYMVVATNCRNSATSPVALVTVAPRLLQPRSAGPGVIELPFESAPGRPVSLEMKPSLPLSEGSWTILATTNSPTVGGEFLDSHATDPHRYYRLRLEP